MMKEIINKAMTVKRNIYSYSTHIIQSNGLIWLYLVLLSVAEVCIAMKYSACGTAIHASLVLILTLHGGLGRQEQARRLASALVLVPLLRILSLTLPVQNLPQWAWYLAMAAPLLVSVWVLVYQFQLGWAALGIRSSMPLVQLMLMGGGLGVGAAEYALLHHAQLATTFMWNTVALATLLVLIGVGVFEEIIFRGLLQTLALPVLGRGALIYVSLLYAVLFFGYRSWPLLGCIFALGLVCACATRWSGSTFGVIIAHGLANLTAFGLLPWLQGQTDPQIITAARAIIAAGSSVAVLACVFLIWQQVRPRRAVALRPAPPDLRVLRRSAGLTYVDLALRTGIPARQLAEVELGDRALTPEYRQRIGKVLNIEVWQLKG